MDNNNKTVQSTDEGLYSQLAPQNHQIQRDDEIDLFELVQTLWEAKLQIILIGLLFVVIGGAYAFLSTPIYDSEFKITLSKESNLYAINDSELVVLTPESSLALVREKLLSAENFADFYALNAPRFPLKPDTLSDTQFAYEIFSKNIKLIEPKGKKGDQLDVYLGLNYQYPAGIEGYTLLNDYLNWTTINIKNELKDDFLSLRENQIKVNQKKLDQILVTYDRNVESKITRLKEQDQFQRKELLDKLAALKDKLMSENQQKVLVLNENIAIARELKFKKPTSPSDAKEQLGSANSEVIKAEFSAMDKLPLYFRGYESLEAEKAELLKRTKDNFPSDQITELERQIALTKNNREIEKLLARDKPKMFLDSYLELEQKNNYLAQLEMREMDARLYVMQSKALTPIKPIKPKKLLILVLSGLLGGMFAVFFVLVRSAMRNRQKSVELV